MEIVQVSTPQHVDAIRELFVEFYRFALDEQGIDLGYQGFQAELAGLPGKYAPPAGRLLLVLDGEQAAGCVALRPQEAGICEVKRMYIRPAYQGRGLGRALAERILAEAAAAGYRLARLDTADTLHAARTLYLSLGFHEAAPYYEPPENIRPRIVFYEKELL